jgi:hypothetical protein
MVRLVLISLAWLTACSTAGPHFLNIPATRVSVESSEFDIRVRGDIAEAIRTNPQYAPRIGPLRERAAFAMARVSGCEVVRVLGDQAQMIGELSCDGRPKTWVRPAAGTAFSCVQLDGGLRDLSGGPYYEYDCDPY